MDGKVIANYLQQLLALVDLKLVSLQRPALKGVASAGISADFLLFYLFSYWGASLGTAHIVSFLISIITCLILYHLLVDKIELRRFTGFFVVALLALLMRGGLLATLCFLFHWTPQTAIIPTVAGSTFLIYLGSSFIYCSKNGKNTDEERAWRNFGVLVIVFTVLIRLLYLGASELIQEEAYYWNYAQHMDIGYLDHPPMVAVLIWLGTSLFGDSEFGVRIGSFMCWFITAYFGFGLAASMFNRTVAFRAVLLIAILPIFAGTAQIITPDSPLVAAWAGSLYFLYRALVQHKKGSWLGVGICLGLGMVSKYTIVFLGPAIIVFMLIDGEARRWFLKSHPYLAAILALVLFSPVIIWNAQHDWASFYFQSQGRITEESQFSTDLLIGSILLLLTPTGLLAAFAVLWPTKKNYNTLVVEKNASPCRAYRFCAVMTLVPLLIFFVFSLTKEIKINWTGPLWLGVIPLLAYSMIPAAQQTGTTLLQWSQRAWKATIILLMVLYGCALHYLSLGLPGLNYIRGPFLFGFADLALQVEDIIAQKEKESGSRPLVVGMDKYKIASGLTYYRHKVGLQNGAPASRTVTEDTTGAHIFTEPSLMFRYWFPALKAEGRDIMILSEAKWPMLAAATHGLVKKHGEIHEITTTKNGKEAGRFYYKFVSGYHAAKVR
jgi:dolichol-phosphate mannosyltransferase